MELSGIATILAEKCALNKEQPIIVGVSGGADSLCLLHLLKRLDYPILVAHVNHQIRPEADSDEVFVRKFADFLGARFASAKVDAMKFAKENKLSLEESARHLRYNWLFQLAAAEDAQALAIAHQADDQVETVMMHILRGAGPGGIKGMGYRSYLPMFSHSTPVVRPLLGVWRDEIDEYCRENGIKPCQDASNTDIRYFRNRIRSELIPELQSYNPLVKHHLWQLSQLALEEDEYLQEQAAIAVGQIITIRGGGFFVLDKNKFLEIPLSIQRRVLRYCLSTLRADLRDIGFDAIEKGVEFITQPSANGDWQLLDDLWISHFNTDHPLIRTGKADLSELWPMMNDTEELRMAVPGVTMINHHWRIKAEIETEKRVSPVIEDAFQAYFDIDALHGKLFLQTPEPGVTFKPFGASDFTQKLSDLFVNEKVNRLARKRWPILYCGDELLWVVGVKRGNGAPISEKTGHILVFKLEQWD